MNSSHRFWSGHHAHHTHKFNVTCFLFTISTTIFYFNPFSFIQYFVWHSSTLNIVAKILFSLCLLFFHPFLCFVCFLLFKLWYFECCWKIPGNIQLSNVASDTYSIRVALFLHRSYAPLVLLSIYRIRKETPSIFSFCFEIL